MNCSGSNAPTDILEFRCNICGQRNSRPTVDLSREGSSCDTCGSSVRARAIVHMLARELFEANLAIPDFPAMRAVRGIGLSDSCFPERLAAKLSYTNTYYHQEPRFDIVNPAPEHHGAYDFLISSEVFEHVAPPVDRAFGNAARVLQPRGILLLTVPYTLGDQTAEHFPALHDYGLAQLRSKTVLVNRTATGEVQVFEDLCFHGGEGSTLEIRRFTEKDLRRALADAGFESVRIYGENYLPFGIVHQETWSLPIAARKKPFMLPHAGAIELLRQWEDRSSRAQRLEEELARLRTDYQTYEQFASRKIAELEQDTTERTVWGRGLEEQVKERTEWACSLERDLAAYESKIHELEDETVRRGEWGTRLQAEIDEFESRLRVAAREIGQTQLRLDHVNRKLWTRVGRKLGLLD